MGGMSPARATATEVVMSTDTKHAAGRAAWSVESWAAFWRAPDPDLARRRVPIVVTPDIVGYWPRSREPVRGATAYCQRILDLLTIVPDLRLQLEEHATNGDYVFIRWSGRGTGPDGPFGFNGVDRIRLRDGRVVENRIISDHGLFAHLAAQADAATADKPAA
jgi:hypothetical protein